MLVDGDFLLLDDGICFKIVVVEEDFIEIVVCDRFYLIEFVWYFGNWYFVVQVEEGCIFIFCDYVIEDMLVGFGVMVCCVCEVFQLVCGVYYFGGYGYVYGYYYY